MIFVSDTIDCPGGNTHYSCWVQYSCSGLKIEMSSYASKAKAAKSFAGKTYFLCTYTDAFHLGAHFFLQPFLYNDRCISSHPLVEKL